ncbi:MAG: ADP-ribosylglycohydrolase family protein [Mongoliitalea sp.]
MENFYVYVYIDPRNYEEFYYGKGKGSRKEAHLKFDENAENDSGKTKIIREIKKEGLEPIIKVIAKGLTEKEALLVEKTLIWKLGKILTNKSSGHFAEKFRPHNKLHVNLLGFDFENGLYYVNVGEGNHRCWEDCKQYGFLSAGQHPKWSDPIKMLEAGDVVVAYLENYGYVGVGKVSQKAVKVNEFVVNQRPLKNYHLKQPGIFENSENINSEFLVRVDWIKAVDKESAAWKKKSGLFTTQLVKASLDNQAPTLYFIEKEFGLKFSDILIANEANQKITGQLQLLSKEEKKRDRYLGCILGGAIGDALGAPIEFLSYEAIVKKYGCEGVQSYVEHPKGKGEFTDDTQMLLFTAEGLLRALHRSVIKGIGGGQTTLTYRSYLRWLKTQGYTVADSGNIYGFEEGWLIRRKELYKQRFPGNSCLTSLESGRMGTIESPINDSKGCGTVMRIAPAGLIFNHDREVAFEEGVKLSAITHGHPSGYLSGGLLASIIADLSNGLGLETAIRYGLELLKKWKGHEELYRKIEQAFDIHRRHINQDITHLEIQKVGEGWVAEEALAISLLCALHYPHDFRKAVTVSINHSGDSDSTGAITGNLVGLMVGQAHIPHEWKENLLYKDIVEEIGEDLSIGCKSGTFSEDEDWHLKYPGY